MSEQRFFKGEGRTRVSLSVFRMGSELVVFIHNENAHVGAVAIGEYDYKEKRASTSVITRLGHKDDIVAQRMAHLLAKYFRTAVCTVAGIHLDNITDREIDQIIKNVDLLGRDLIEKEGNICFGESTK